MLGSWEARRYNFHWRDWPLPEPYDYIDNTSKIPSELERPHRPLLVFIDSLVLLDILQKWEKASFNSRPHDILHFDVFPLLNVLRHWQYPVLLVKVKSHTGCLMTERADKQAELGTSNPLFSTGQQLDSSGGLLRPSEVWVPLAESPAACSCLEYSVSEAAREGRRSESESPKKGSGGQHAACSQQAQHHLCPTARAPE